MSQTTVHAGDKPGKGSFQCIGCPYIIDLEEGEELPICPVCGITEYIQL